MTASRLLFLLYCVAVVAAVRLGLTLFSYRRIVRYLPKVSPRPDADPPDLGRLRRSIGLAAKLVPRASCLTQALAGQIILARAGIPSVVRIGVAAQDRRSFTAHAWLVCRDRIVLGAPTRSQPQFSVLSDLGQPT